MKHQFTSLSDYFENGPETQDELAARLKISQATVSFAKRGAGSYRMLKRIAEATGVPLESFGGESPKRSTISTVRSAVITDGRGHRAVVVRKADRRSTTQAVKVDRRVAGRA